MSFSHLDRRQFMQTTAAAAAASTALASTSQKKEGWIDAHSHIWTRDVKSYPLKKGQTVDDLDPPSFTTEELINVATQNNVDRVVLIAHHTYYGFDNRYLEETALRQPKKFRVVGMIDDDLPEAGKRMKDLHKRWVTGFRITSWIKKNKWLDSDGMAEMWKCATETGQAICCLMDAEYLDTLDAMCRRNPETPVVIDHFARIGVDGTIRNKDVRKLCSLSKHKNVHVKISAYYALGKKKPPYDDLVPMIKQCIESFGVERLMWASDAPYQLTGGNTYSASIKRITEGMPDLSTGEREWLLRGTAKKVYQF